MSTNFERLLNLWKNLESVLGLLNDGLAHFTKEELNYDETVKPLLLASLNKLNESNEVSFETLLNRIEELTDQANKHTKKNKAFQEDAFFGFKLNTTQQIKNDLKQANFEKFAEAVKTTKNPICNDIKESAKKHEIVFDDYDFFTVIMQRYKAKSTKGASSILKNDDRHTFSLDKLPKKNKSIDYSVHPKLVNYTVVDRSGVGKTRVSHPQIRQQILANLFSAAQPNNYLL